METVGESQVAAHDGRSARSVTVARRSKLRNGNGRQSRGIERYGRRALVARMAEIEAWCDRIRRHMKEARALEHEDARLSRNAGVVIR